MKAILLLQVLRGPSTLDSIGRIVLCCAGLAIAGCFPSSHVGKEGATSKEPTPAFMNIQDSSDLRVKDFFKGPSAAQFGDDLQVWYKDFGDTVEIVTASEHRILLHVNTSDDHQAGGRFEVVYSTLDGGAVCSHYSRSPGSPASCGEHQTAVDVMVRQKGAVREEWWRLPKREISVSGREAFVAFEVFDQATQSSHFFPEAPYSLVKLSFGGVSVEASNSVPARYPAPVPPKNVVQSAVPFPRQSALPRPAPPAPSPANIMEHSEHPPTVIGCVSQCYVMQLSSLGTLIEDGKHYSLSDPRFASGTNLILSIIYKGVEPNQTNLSVEWYVGKKPVSFFSAYRASSSSGRWSRQYDNDTVWAGEYRIVLKVNGQEMDQPRLNFWVDVAPPQAVKQPDRTHQDLTPLMPLVGTTISRQ